jgi:fructose-bisphosphate aldolase, class II
MLAPRARAVPITLCSVPLVSMRQLLDEAAAGAYGVGAFNVNNLEQIQAIMEAARETRSPVIVQASRGARAYTNDRFLWHLMQAAVELYPEIPVALHLDHGNDPATCISAIELGFTSVMMDGSLEADGKTPASFEYNVAVTNEVVAYAHARGVTVEGELGTLGGIEDGHGSGEVHLTDPDQAVEFVEDTGIDALAVAIGTSHGAYKFSQAPDGEVLRMDLIQEIHRRLPDTHLVMHGSSSVPQELVAKVNRYGGALKPAWGVPREEIQLGIRHGVRKINVDTDSRLAITGAIRQVFVETPEAFDPRDYLKPARAAMQALIAERMADFGQAGHAGDYEPLSLEEMGERYATAAART